MTQWKMLKYLWTKKQNKLDLIEAFIFRPGDLEKMYEEETKFEECMENSWKGKKNERI